MTALLHLPFEPENSQTKSRNKTKKKKTMKMNQKNIKSCVVPGPIAYTTNSNSLDWLSKDWTTTISSPSLVAYLKGNINDL